MITPVWVRWSYPGETIGAMDGKAHHERPVATQPEDLSRMVVERLNAGDVEGLAALYEPHATLALPGGRTATGTDQIRAAYQRLLADRPRFEPGEQLPTLRSGELAMTSTRLTNGAVTAEVARRQPDGTWLWVLDQPNVSAPRQAP